MSWRPGRNGHPWQWSEVDPAAAAKLIFRPRPVGEIKKDIAAWRAVIRAHRDPAGHNPTKFNGQKPDDELKKLSRPKLELEWAKLFKAVTTHYRLGDGERLTRDNRRLYRVLPD